MHYRELRPCAPLRRFVECFWFLNHGAPAAPRDVERIVPDGCTELIVHLGEPFERVTAEGFEEQSSAFLVGQMPHFILLRPSRRIATLGVRFRPAAARRFFPESADRLTGRFVALGDLWGALAERVESRLHEASAPADQAKVLEDVLLQALRGGGEAIVTLTADFILKSEGRVSVSEAARHAGLSERSLERRFRAELGLAPKAFARIARLQGVLRAVGRQARPDWAGVAADCAYFDQPHLIREFRALTGETPAEFVRNQGRMSMNFTDPARLTSLLQG